MSFPMQPTLGHRFKICIKVECAEFSLRVDASAPETLQNRNPSSRYKHFGCKGGRTNAGVNLLPAIRINLSCCILQHPAECPN